MNLLFYEVTPFPPHAFSVSMAAIQLEVMLGIFSIFISLERRWEGTSSHEEGGLNVHICASIRVCDVYLATYLFLKEREWCWSRCVPSPTTDDWTRGGSLIQRGPTRKLVSDLGLCVLAWKDDVGQSFELRDKMRSCSGVCPRGKRFHRDMAGATMTGHVQNETGYPQKKRKQQVGRRCWEKEREKAGPGNSPDSGLLGGTVAQPCSDSRETSENG